MTATQPQTQPQTLAQTEAQARPRLVTARFAALGLAALAYFLIRLLNEEERAEAVRAG